MFEVFEENQRQERQLVVENCHKKWNVKIHRMLEGLIGGFQGRMQSITDSVKEWEDVSGLLISDHVVWKVFTPIEFEPLVERFAGGRDGRIIARLPSAVSDTRFSRTVFLHDHRFNVIGECEIPPPCGRVFLHVTHGDSLIVLTSGGKLHTFRGTRLVSTIDVGLGAPIVEAAFWDNGVAFWDEESNLALVPFFKKCEVLEREVKDAGWPAQMQVIPPAYTANGSPYVFVVDCSGNLRVFSRGGVNFAIDMPAPIVSMCLSPGYKFIAFVLEPKTLVVTDITLENSHLTVDVDCGEVFSHLGWIKDDVPLVAIDDNVIAVTQTGEVHYVQISQGSKPVIMTGKDYALVLTRNELVTVNVVKKCFCRCAQQLDDGWYPAGRLIEAFEKRIASKVLQLRDENKLEEAVDDCIKTALLLDDVEQQKTLMMAAAFGKAYIPKYDNSKFSQAVQILRQMNVFKNELNIIMPHQVLKSPREAKSDDMRVIRQRAMQAEDIVLRLCVRGKHAVALEFAEQLEADKSKIVTDWCGCVMSAIDDDEMCLKLINQKMGTSFDACAVATAAIQAGREQLAMRIAEMESVRAKVVPFYISIGCWQEAIKTAANSGDSSLFIDTLRKASEAIDEEEIATAIGQDIFSFCAVANFVQGDMQNRFAQLLRRVPISPPVLSTLVFVRVRQLVRAGSPSAEGFQDLVTLLTNLKNDLGLSSGWIDRRGKVLAFLAKAKSKRDNFEKKGMSFEGESPNDVIRSLIKANNLPLAIKYGKSIGLTEKRVISLATSYLAEKELWGSFSNFAASAYKENWPTIVAILALRAGVNRAREFANSLPDPRPFLEQLESPTYGFESHLHFGMFKGGGIFGK